VVFGTSGRRVDRELRAVPRAPHDAPCVRRPTAFEHGPSALSGVPESGLDVFVRVPLRHVDILIRSVAGCLHSGLSGPWQPEGSKLGPAMARRTIYVPNWLDRRLRVELPAEENISATACRSLEARFRALDGCEHDAPQLCARCLTEVPKGG